MEIMLIDNKKFPLMILFILVSLPFYASISDEYRNAYELCNVLENNSIDINSKECSKYKKQVQKFEVTNKKFKSMKKEDEKRKFFPSFVKEYRVIDKHSEDLMKSLNRSINTYILENYTSNEEKVLKNVNKLFSSDKVQISDAVIKDLVNNNGGNVNLSQSGLEKVSKYVNRVKNQEEVKIAEKKVQQAPTNYRVHRTKEQKTRDNSTLMRVLYKDWMKDIQEHLYLCKKTYSNPLLKSVYCEMLGNVYMGTGHFTPLYTKAKAAFYLACDGGRLPRACKRYNELAAQGD